MGKITRDPSCPFYSECLTKAALVNAPLDCRRCTKRPPGAIDIEDVTIAELAGMHELFRVLFGDPIADAEAQGE